MEYKDFDNKPLPDHTKIDYYECLAKLVLEKIFPEEFSGLVLSDKPDLQNPNQEIGIEVTRAIDPIQERNENLYVKIESGQIRDREKAINTINSSCKNRMIFLDGEVKEFNLYNNGMLTGLIQGNNFKRILKSFEQKIKKLNGNGFKKFSNNYLFVYSHILADQEMINQALTDMKLIGTQYNYIFSKVYVYVPSYIYVLDLNNHLAEILNIAKFQNDLGNQAREIVIQNEIDL